MPRRLTMVNSWLLCPYDSSSVPHTDLFNYFVSNIPDFVVSDFLQVFACSTSSRFLTFMESTISSKWHLKRCFLKKKILKIRNLTHMYPIEDCSKIELQTKHTKEVQKNISFFHSSLAILQSTRDYSLSKQWLWI